MAGFLSRFRPAACWPTAATTRPGGCKPDRSGRAARLRRGLVLRPCPRWRAGRCRRQSDLLSRAQSRSTKSRATASAGGGRWPKRWRFRRPQERGPLATCRFSAEPVRRADDGPLRLLLCRPRRWRRRHEEERERHLRPAHAGRRRNDRPAGHRHQAVRAARRVQLHQDLSADRRRAARRATAHRRSKHLAQIFENRRQYPKAADYLAARDQGIRPRRQRLPAAAARPDRRQLGPLRAGHDAAGRQGATVDFRFRNGKQGQLRGPRDQGREAARRREGLSQDSTPSSSTGRRSTSATSAIGSCKRTSSSTSARRSPRWELDLEPRPEHFDSRITVTTPLQKAGAYLLTAKMADGNTSQHRRLGRRHGHRQEAARRQGTFYFVADAVTGEPIAKANVEFFGYRQKQVGSTNQFQVDIANFAEFTDADGQVIGRAEAQTTTRLPVARHGHDADAGPLRLSRLHAASGTAATTTPNTTQTKVFAITDRPVYRPEPEGEVQVLGPPRQVRPAGHVGLRRPEVHRRDSQSQGREGRLRRSSQTDDYGGIEGEFELAGRRHARRLSALLVAERSGGGSFRVEEYKKPEFEVTVDAPDRAGHAGRKDHRHDQGQVLLRLAGHQGQGEVQGPAHQLHAAAGIRSAAGTGSTARATGGSPTTTPGIPAGAIGAAGGRSRLVAAFAASRRKSSPKREVADRRRRHGRRSRSTRPLAKAIHPDQDHSYEITAEVVDESRRTIVGTGKVLVARKPFKVFAWVDRGYYRVGRRDRRPISPPARSTASRSQGKGKLDAAARSPTTKTASRSRTPVRRMEPRHRRRRPGRAADQGLASRASIGCRTS